MPQPLFKHKLITRLPRLLDMLYKPGELADELGIPVDTIYRSHLPAGAPHTREASGLLWIHGPAYREWVRVLQRQKRDRIRLPENQAWCMKCKAPVPLINPRIKATNHYLELLQARCPTCGARINRARAKKNPPPNTPSGYLGEGREGVQ